MIKGAIEAVSPQGVSGWMYSSALKLRDALVLAFVGEACVGSGRLDRFRQDLADVGFDDGYLGFSFPIALPAGADTAAVVVRLDGCEAVLVQRRSRITGPETARGAAEPSLDETLRRIAWLRRRDAVTDAEEEFLRGLARFGVSEVALDAEPGTAPEAAALASAARVLELAGMTTLDLRLERVPDGDTMLERIRGALDQPGTPGHVALWSPVSTRVGVVEAGHLPGAVAPDPAGAVDYRLAPSSLLVLHPRGVVVPRIGAGYAGVAVISGAPGRDAPGAGPGPGGAR